MHASASYYNALVLTCYDYCVHSLFMVYLWGCPTTTVTLPFFKSNIGRRHMDVGVGTGYFPAAVRQSVQQKQQNHAVLLDSPFLQWPEKLLLVDLNPNCTEMAASRVGVRDRTEILIVDVFQPLPAVESVEKYDSISLMNLLHCLPGSAEYKSQVFGNLKPFLKDNGTLFGGTILGKGVQHNFLGKALMWVFNCIGIFHNYEDEKGLFLQVLEKEFGKVDHVVVGRILLFVAKEPLL
ncbi:uncharacterized protein N7511_005835 [Penicillium nucicola]|uniref:uncharacterized protein n=1 Tax=Penicillium nucicola TaxID=1850975 RepID=UPI00254534F8|nr:uncharacterized protein N7511_005835 [Penicillium nucicola]KAJ5762453.1 hypothetical protein N7511_005835 [Penicillium nucicola]